MTWPHIERAAGVLFGAEKGLFVYSPIILFGVLGTWEGLRRKLCAPVVAFCGLTSFVCLAYSSSFCCWDTTSFGPKYFVPVLPFLILPLAFLDLRSRAMRWAIGSALVVSILINWTGAQFGFAETVMQNFRSMITHGPTLPVFDAILTHSKSPNQLNRFAESFHSIITLAATLFIVLFCLFVSGDARTSILRRLLGCSARLQKCIFLKEHND